MSQNQELRDILQADFAWQNLQCFIYATLPNYQMGWVHRQVCYELDIFLEAVMRKESPRLMLTMPPRSGKSEIASRRFPAYALGRYPDLSIIATSYSADLAARMNRDVQRIIDEPSYERIFPKTRLFGKNIRTVVDGSYMRNSDVFEIVGYSGVYRSAGVGGGITGMGADIAIIDDPFKDRMSADSQTIRQNIWEWYTSTLYTRLAPGGGIILINTRWHEDDLSGRLLAEMAKGEGDQWRCVNFPAIAEEDEKFRRKGEALHPERYPLEQLLKIKAAIGTRDWEALYQQHPTPEGGAVFLNEWLQRTWLPKDLPENFDSVVQSWDMTFKDGEASDFVVGQLWGRKGADFYLLDQLRGRWSFTESVEQVRHMQVRSRRYGKRSCRVLIEDKANGPAIIDMLKHEIGGIIPVQPDGSKVARAHAVTALFEAGNVFLPDKSMAPWIDEFRLELTRFPSGAHDDQCFPAGTMIATPYGKRPIEQIKAGDIVLTPFGCKSVVWSGKTGIKTVCTKRGISATMNHPFVRKDGKIEPFEYINLEEDSSRLTFKEVMRWKYRKLLCSMESNTDLWEPASIISASQKVMKADDTLKDFMLQFGSIIQGKKYKKAMIFIIRTGTLLITTLATLSVYHGLNIAKGLITRLRKSKSTLMKSDPSQVNGIEATRGVNGIGSTQEGLSVKQSLKSFVRTVALYFGQKQKALSFVPITAKLNTGMSTTEGQKPEYALGAGIYLKQRWDTEVTALRRVAGHAGNISMKRREEKKESVYNLTVEDCHLFYANDYLVHNCDATTQALRYLDKRMGLHISNEIFRGMR